MISIMIGCISISLSFFLCCQRTCLIEHMNVIVSPVRIYAGGTLASLLILQQYEFSKDSSRKFSAGLTA
jgi:hypothetical protein